MGKRIKGNVIINQEVQELTPQNKLPVSNFREVQFKSRAERLAQDSLYYRNHYYAGGKQMFPDKPEMQTVDKYFPYAEGGPLFIDEMSLMDNPKNFEVKTQKMKELGHRYIAISPKMTDSEILERLI